MANNNEKNPSTSPKAMLDHTNRSLFNEDIAKGHFGTDGYYTTEDPKVLLEFIFVNKLHQSSDSTKKYYSILKNELMSYNASARMGTEYEIFLLFEKSVAKLAIYCGKIRLTLGFNKKRIIKALKKEVNKLENILVSNGYIDMYVSNDEQCARAIDLIGVLMNDLHVNKIKGYKLIDYVPLYPVIEDASFSFIEDEKKFIPEVVVKGDDLDKGLPKWFLVLLFILIIGIAILTPFAISNCKTKEEQIPTFDILNNDQNSLFANEYINQVDIFNDPLYDGEKIIYPGRQSVYPFYIANQNTYDFKCSLTFTHENIWDIHMRYRLKVAGVYVTGAQKPWMSLEELNEFIDLNNIYVPANSKLYCELEWKWEDSDNDTEIGKNGLATYSLTFTFNDFKKIEKNK